MIAISCMIYVQKMPVMYYAYIFFPIFFWNQILRNYRTLIDALRLYMRNGIIKSSMTTVAFLLFLEALVSYINRHSVYKIPYLSYLPIGF